MTRFRYWRKMTWAIVVWTAAMAVLLVSGGVTMTPLIWAFGLAFLGWMWFSTRPLWRVGHGARWRRLHSADVPFKSAEGLASPRGRAHQAAQ